uniref:Putative ovule protein n=1 Tax=Solanum chacoense TaxID=4108 RepID=A0A0V0GPG6_SOLCH
MSSNPYCHLGLIATQSEELKTYYVRHFPFLTNLSFSEVCPVTSNIICRKLFHYVHSQVHNQRNL